MGPWVVPEFQDEGMTLQRCLDEAALHPAPTSVNDSHLVPPRRCRRRDIFRDDGRHVFRRKGVKIQLGFDRDANRLGHESAPAFLAIATPSPVCRVRGDGSVNAHGRATSGRPAPAAEYSARTTVLMPPRTEKSPTTLIRRG